MIVITEWRTAILEINDKVIMAHKKLSRMVTGLLGLEETSGEHVV